MILNENWEIKGLKITKHFSNKIKKCELNIFFV